MSLDKKNSSIFQTIFAVLPSIVSVQYFYHSNDMFGYAW